MMRIFKPNDELAGVLLANGYKEVNSRESVIHKQVNVKREFAIFNKNVTSQTPHIQFLNSAIKENNFRLYQQVIEEQKLKALICFHKLAGSMGNMLKNKFRYSWQIDSISNFFEELKDDNAEVTKQISKPLRMKILKAYENVIV
jgi:hypothetical protein